MCRILKKPFASFFLSSFISRTKSQRPGGLASHCLIQMVLLLILFIGLDKSCSQLFYFYVVALLNQIGYCFRSEPFAVEADIWSASACPQSSSYRPCFIVGSTWVNLTTAVTVFAREWSEICSRTVKDAHRQPRHNYGCPRTLYGSPQTLYSSYTYHPGCYYLPGSSQINTAVL